MSYLDLYTEKPKSDRAELFPSRDKHLEYIKRHRNFDLVVIGGGIHGAASARIAALNGLRVLLLEKEDYAFGTSSRSSKMAHGGLRYLEMLDLRQVFEGIKARNEIFRTSSHIAKAHDFFIPTRTQFDRIKFGVGLGLYQLLGLTRRYGHRMVQEGPHGLGAGYLFQDGLVNDTRLVIENIIAARQEGGICINHASVESISQGTTHMVSVGFTDRIKKDHYEVTTGAVLNCAGPWTPFVGRISASPLRQQIAYSRGSHILFNKRWEGPALCLPLEERGRLYFVWPHPSGTLVGTTERELTTITDDPLPHDDEIEEIFTRLRKDLPGSGLDRDSAFHCFAGIRTIPLRSASAKEVSTLSRRHIWHESGAIFSLVGGKLTTANSTAYEGVRRIWRKSNISAPLISLKGRKLPGTGMYDLGTSEFIEAAVERRLPPSAVAAAIARFGSRVRFLLDKEEYLETLSETLLRGEVMLALEDEQAVTVEDVMMRRLQYDLEPSGGIDVVESVGNLIREKYKDYDVESGVAAYKLRLAAARAILRSS